MEPILIDSSDEENTAPNGAYDRPATPEIPGCALAPPSPPIRPTASRAPPRRATPRLMSESSDESSPASPPQRAAPPAQHPMSESSDESPPTSPPRRGAPPTPPRRYRGPPNPDAPGHSRWFHNPRRAPGYPDPTAAAPPPEGRYSPCSPRQQDPEPDEDDEEEGSRTPSPAASARDEDYVLEDVTDSDATPPYPGYHGEEASEQDDDDAQTISSDSEPDDGPLTADSRPDRHLSPVTGEAMYNGPGRGLGNRHGEHTRGPPAVASTGGGCGPTIFPGDRADDNAPLASTSQQALRIINQTYDDAPLASTSQQALRIINQTYDDAPLASSSQGSIPTANETTEHCYQPTGKVMQLESESSDSETETGQKFRERVAIPAAWWTNTHDQRVPLAVWQEIERRSYAARYCRQRIRVRTQEGPYQITMKTSGRVQIRFGSAE
nr:proline-rich receptor-like protein kinase PERK8 [Drosophila kikkawai]